MRERERGIAICKYIYIYIYIYMHIYIDLLVDVLAHANTTDRTGLMAIIAVIILITIINNTL